MNRTRSAHDNGNRKGGRKTTSMRYNRYDDDFLINKKQTEELNAEMVIMGDLVADEKWQIINDSEHSWQEDHNLPEKEVDLEQSEIERRENTILTILEWMHDLQADEEETQSIQQVDISAGKLVGGRNSLSGWTATDQPLDINLTT